MTGEPDDDLGERVIAWVVLEPTAPTAAPRRDHEQLGSELVDHVAAQLAPHKRPRTVHFLDELPRNDLGKVQKKRLERSEPRHNARLRLPNDRGKVLLGRRRRRER